MSLFGDLQYNFFGKLRQNLSVIRTCLKLALEIFKYRFTASEKTKKNQANIGQRGNRFKGAL